MYQQAEKKKRRLTTILFLCNPNNYCSCFNKNKKSKKRSFLCSYTP